MNTQNVEIERKFLVIRSKLPIDFYRGEFEVITQGYLSTKPAVRVRLIENPINGRRAKLTIKGPGLLTRQEFEYNIPYQDGVDMMKLCKFTITKTRFKHLSEDGHLWEVDVFWEFGKLVLAELELKSEDEEFIKPEWVGDEVTNDPSYSNVNLAQTRKTS
jgi:CYTH domain-containing protein